MLACPVDINGILSDVPSASLGVTTAPAHPAPPWLLARLQAAGGSVPFRTYMEWALHDPEHGYYGRGQAQIGPAGDFSTSPSMGEEFAAMLLPQVCEWLEQLPGDRLSVLEAGPGEGQLAGQLARGLAQLRPDLASRTELVLLEPNPGMVAKQRQALRDSPLPLRWSAWEDLHRQPLTGVVIAHEVLDALPVDRLLWDGSRWRWQHVTGDREGGLSLCPGPALRPAELEELEELADLAGWPALRAPGWCTESHPGLEPWFQACGGALRDGVLLVVDYALEARRYYSAQRANGTLLAYRGQQAQANPLLSPGEWDLTAHVCLEAAQRAAVAAGWQVLGERRQGEALLALGLAERLASPRRLSSVNLAEELRRREQLLRLVDPLTLGEFRWLVFERATPPRAAGRLSSRCLREPGPDPDGFGGGGPQDQA
ncbi:MAG: SAM-dependent methyltransferase [Cyanobacteriota bacterium]|nr:SAM-dependent methyltransferase [Cyanobacteriota bacterium]